MSQELSPAVDLEQLAHSRLTDFGLVALLTAQYEQEHDELGLPPQPLEEGGTLRCVTSGMAAVGVAQRDRLEIVAGGMLARTQLYPEIMVHADFVGLWPRARDGQGEAALYRVGALLSTEVQVATLPFSDTVGSVLDKGPIELPREYMDNQYTNAQAPPGDDRRWFGSGSYTGQPLIATEGTELEVRPTDRRNDLANPPTREVDVCFRGQAIVVLDHYTFLRLSADRLEAAPPQATTARLKLWPTTPQRQPDNRVVPQDATLVLGDDGTVVDAADRGQEGLGHFPHNPRIMVSDIPGALVEPLSWQDVTQLFLDRMRRKLLEVMSVDQEAVNRYVLSQARDVVASNLKGLPPRVVGCAAVAAALDTLIDQTQPAKR